MMIASKNGFNVRGGAQVSITPALNSGVKIADYSVGKVTGVLYAPGVATSSVPGLVKPDGTTISVDANGTLSSNLTTEVTYSQLLELCNNGHLVPGQQYRITDYVATVSSSVSSSAQSANHPFDIIVTADSATTLNEKARAIAHSGNSYFNNCNPEAWQIWYSFENDTNKFSWADNENGKGVIYRMIDEWNNDCPYDFKGIQFKPHPRTDTVWRYTFDDGASTGNTDISLSSWLAYDNCILPAFDENTSSRFLNANVFTGTCHSNSFQSNCSRNTFNYGCNSNTFGTDCSDNTFSYECIGNVFNNDCSGNKIYSNCINNIFGNSCKYNEIYPNSENNVLGNGCESNIIGEDCLNNIFGNSCGSNELGTGCECNVFWNNCESNVIGDGSNFNSIGNYSTFNQIEASCLFNSIKSNSHGNILSEGCQKNSIGNECSENALGICSYSNTFGDGCNNIIFGTDSSNLNAYYRYIIVETGNQYIKLNSTGTTSDSSYYQNVLIAMGVNNTTTYKTITDSNVGQTFKTTYQPASSQMVTISSITPTMTFTSSLSVKAGNTASTSLTTNSDGAVSYVSSNTNIATVNSSGVVTGVAAGTCTITASTPSTNTCNAASANCAVTVVSASQTRVIFQNGTENYYSVSGELTRSIVNGWGDTITEVEIGTSVTSIGDNAFYDNSNVYRYNALTSITIPNSVTSIGIHPFCWCSGLTSLTIPSSVSSLSQDVFFHQYFSYLTIENTNISIATYAFNACGDFTLEMNNTVSQVQAMTPSNWFSGTTGTVTIVCTDGSFEVAYECFVKGTKITMSDGTQKNVENLEYGDELKVWDFDNGVLSTAPICWLTKRGLKNDHYYELTFSDGSVLKTTGQNSNHKIFNVTTGRFEGVNNTQVGDTIYSINGTVTVTNKQYVEAEVEYYNVMTSRTVNCFAEGILASNRYSNLYPTVNMVYDKTGRTTRPYSEYEAVGIDRYWYDHLRIGESTDTVEQSKTYIGKITGVMRPMENNA